MSLKPSCLLPALVLAILSAPAQAREMEEHGVAVLRTIDKRAARTSTFEVPVGQTVKFGKSLFIKARACRSASALDKPENAAFLQIWERQPAEEESRWVFSGWMFSSSPSVSRMDHPVYDVWVIECKDTKGAKPEGLSSEPAPAAEGMPVQEKPETAPATAEEAGTAPEGRDSEAAPAETERLSPEQLNATPSFEESDGETAVSAQEDDEPAR